MSIEKSLYAMNVELEKAYGIQNMIHTVIMDHKNFDRMFYELGRTQHFMKVSPSDANDMTIYGVRVLARYKETAK